MSVKPLYELFVINLAKDIVKKEHIANQLNELKYQPIFIEAVYGKELSTTLLNKFYDKKSSIAALGRELGFGEIGCFLSHVNIYKRIVEENIQYSIILEDDIQLTRDLNPAIEKIINLSIPWELVLLGHHSRYSRLMQTPSSLWGGIKLSNGYSLDRPCDLGCGTYGYLISLSGAKNLLKHLNKVVRPIDHYTGNDQLTNLYVVNPPIIAIDQFLTDNYHSMGDRSLNLQRQMKPSKLASIKRMFIVRHVISLKDALKKLYHKVRPIRVYKKMSSKT